MATVRRAANNGSSYDIHHSVPDIPPNSVEQKGATASKEAIAMAHSPADTAGASVTRREFLDTAAFGTAAAALFAGLLGLLRMPKPNVHYEPDSKVRLGFPNEFPEGTSRILERHNVMVLRDEKGLHVMSLICTHLGCIVQKAETGFRCPCHGSMFSPAGNVESGPAPKALEWLDVSRAEDGALVVDLKKPVKAGTKTLV